MPSRLEENNDDDAMQEILRRAMHKEAAEGGQLRDRLLSAADELGISHEAVLLAEMEYQDDRKKAQELAAYEAESRKGFNIHLTTYLAVNIFLIVVNFFTFSQGDRAPWSILPILGWGIGLVIHAVVWRRKPDWNDEEFQRWRRRREDAEDDD